MKTPRKKGVSVVITLPAEIVAAMDAERLAPWMTVSRLRPLTRSQWIANALSHVHKDHPVGRFPTPKDWRSRD